ncbi:C-type lectin domain family 4 member E-like [Patiria miniata]|uniref:C-type lectin domain-containing protein n=1 Tax=Patiria miniata TaxID=46514 RepID=A0A913ZY51_PATMI|nr:C-type lectin domain family 4 member E-like [Patiria miniata]
MLPKRLIIGLISLCLMIRCTGGNERCGASIRGACPPAWSQWGDKCYKQLSKNLPWAEAKQECIKKGSVLVVPQSQEETEFLQNNMHRQFWINCSDLQVEGTWVCQDGTTDVEYSNWKTGEPNNAKGIEDCAVVTASGDWNDVPCNGDSPVICQRPAPQLHF